MKPREDSKSHMVRIHLTWAFVLVSFGVIAFSAYKLSLDRAGDAASRVLDEGKRAVAAATAKAERYAGQTAAFAERAAEKFKTGRITETFRAEIPVFKSAGIGLLEVGTAEATETFHKSDVRKVAWDWVYLGETVSEISVPVTYRYHLDLAGVWEITVADGNCLVRAPELQPSLPVAIHTDKLQKKSSSGWARFDANEQIEELQMTITPKLNANAARPDQLNQVREEARAAVARFIRAWLVREEQWMEGKLTSVTVIFPDEPANAKPPAPTVTYKEFP